jgi:hypothetical protein
MLLALVDGILLEYSRTAGTVAQPHYVAVDAEEGSPFLL